MTARNRAREVRQNMTELSSKHTLPPLPYGYQALEPYIDARTMELHHDHHHASYVATLNTALEEYPELQRQSALWLLLNSSKIPQMVRTSVRNNAGGHVNHSLFWRAMAPEGQRSQVPKGALADAINRDFGTFSQFKARFTEAGEHLFGCGWVWLTESRQDGGKLRIETTDGHDNPLLQGRFPILLNDVWEHGYYLNYESRRGEYLRAWWSIVNWEEAMQRYERGFDQPAERDWEDEGGLVQGVTR